MPWLAVSRLRAAPSGLYSECWSSAWQDGQLDLVVHDGPFIDCGTPADYLAANLATSHGASVIATDAHVEPGAVVERSVVWPQSVVTANEVLVDSIRAGRLTVFVR
ncbi:MAG: hypothetical protein WKF43_03030 [Acidimicrobiales bacterium]